MKAERQQVGMPMLRLADIGGADAVVLSVASVALRNSTFGGNRYVLTWTEIPNRETWLNKTGLNVVIDHYGDETDNWLGKKIPLVRVLQNVRGVQKENLAVAQGEKWDELVKGNAVKGGKKGGKR